MQQFLKIFDSMLVEVYYNLLRLDEYALRMGKLDLTISEMHLLEQVRKGKGEDMTISKIAERLGIKSPSVTVAVKKLESKGYLQKTSCSRDGRAVIVSMTKQGELVDTYHQYYRRMMIKTVSEDLTASEKEVLLRAVEKLNMYFSESMGGKA